jgi:NAD-dependent dihydropyrimidine dehydrogenase PreA subunit
MAIHSDACIDCGKCDKVCPVGLDVRREVGSAECIACGDCKKICPQHGIVRTFGFARQRQSVALPVLQN